MLPQLGLPELIVVMIVAVLLFGKRLPEVGRSLGKGIIEFKKGLRGFEEGMDFSSDTSTSLSRRDDHSSSSSAATQYTDNAVPKFEPPTSAPVPHMEHESHSPQD
jgi:sec-independent protein translocase protein TatA